MAGLLMRLGIVTVFFVALLATILVRSTQERGDVTAEAEDTRPIITRPVLLSTPRVAAVTPETPAEPEPIKADMPATADASRVTLASLPAEAAPQAAPANDAGAAILPLVSTAEAATPDAPPVIPAATPSEAPTAIASAEPETPQAAAPEAPAPLVVAGAVPDAAAPSRALPVATDPAAEAATVATPVETVMTPFPPPDPRRR